jgi:TatD DNase family protein
MYDSHCHLADPAFAHDLEAVVGRARDAGVSGGLCVLALGSDEEAKQADRVRVSWPGVRFAVGLHPHEARAFAGRVDRLASEVAEALARTPGACAVGEIGLVYHYDLSPRDVQRDVFRAQVRIARERRLPVIIHTREADDDTLAIVEQEGGGALDGVFHCFSGSDRLARAALGLGFHLSFSGIVTFPKAGGLRDIAAATPADRLLVETDCPYLAPVPHRGKRNEPAWTVHTAATLSTVRGVDIEEVDRLTSANFERLFGHGQASVPSSAR